MNLILVIVGRILYLILEPINFIYVTTFKKKFKWSRISGYLRSSAVNTDRFGNYEFRSLFNAILITKDGYKFGDFRETISSVIGKNKVKGTLTRTGRILDKILDLLDKNHSIKSINNFKMKTIQKPSIWLAKLHYKYFSNDGKITNLGWSGMALDMVRILVLIVLHILTVDVMKMEEGYKTESWIGLAIVSWIVSPFVCLPLLKWAGNKPRRFMKGAFIPIPYAIIWVFGWHPVGYFDNFDSGWYDEDN